ncbi:MAG: GNAT family N-acetyltransferase [Bacteriovoracaceae bacterium]|nr:GNAT family N-acetyltransferase [Bacteriovoracaceae bacterium]
MQFEVRDFSNENIHLVEKATKLMQIGFKGITNSWENEIDAGREVRGLLSLGKIALIAVDINEEVLGLVGAFHLSYPGDVWELHPIVVKPSARQRGVGKALIEKLEENIKQKGGKTLWLGADDEQGLTSISGKNIYPNLIEHLQSIENIGGHAISFYKKMGFSVAGCLPDANGFGKPDIFFAKRIR